jgi:Methyltransferase FkbM domain
MKRKFGQSKSKPLDAVLDRKDIEKPALLKLGVQGFERQALEGCRSLLSIFSYVYAECSFVELYAGQSLAHEVISIMAVKDLSTIYCRGSGIAFWLT